MARLVLQVGLVTLLGIILITFCGCCYKGSMTRVYVYIVQAGEDQRLECWLDSNPRTDPETSIEAKADKVGL